MSFKNIYIYPSGCEHTLSVWSATNKHCDHVMSSTSSNTPYKDIVLSLKTFIRREVKDWKPFVSYGCWRSNCTNPIVTFKDKSDFKNPQVHLKWCYGKWRSLSEEEEILLTLYHDDRERVRGQDCSIRSHFGSKRLSDYEHAMYGYIRFITMKRLQFQCDEDDEIGSFSQFDIGLLS